MKKFLKKFVSFVIFACIVASFFVYQDWYKVQLNKIRGIYYVSQGDNYLRKAEFQKAIDLYKQALSYYPGHYSAWLNLGNIYVAYEDYYSALDAYEQAIKHNPNYVIARMNYGIISAEKMGDFDGAIAQYKQITGIRRRLVYIPFVFSNLRSYRTNMGLAYYNMGLAYRQKAIYSSGDTIKQEYNLNEAIKAYEEALKYLKNDYDTRYNLALAYHLNGDYNLAGLQYCAAIELEPMNYEAHYNLAVLLKDMRKFKESYEEMSKVNSLLSSKENSTERLRYIFGIMSDVTQQVLLDEEGREFVRRKYEDDSPENKSDAQITYLNGKVVATEELDKAVLKSLSTCNARSLFVDYSDL